MKRPTIPNIALAALLGAGVTAGSLAAPVPVKADSTSTALAIAAAAIVGVLLFDANNRPYYVRDGRRYYVSDNVAEYYYAHRYPTYWRAHRQTWHANRGAFVRDWRGYRSNGYGNGYRHGHRHPPR